MVPKSDDSSQAGQSEGLPDLPNYAQPDEDEEDDKKKRKGEKDQKRSAAQRAASSQNVTGGSGHGMPQMPLPPTYSPGAPASYGQPNSAAQLPMSPTSYGTYNSPQGFGQPGMGPGQMSPGSMMGAGPKGQGQMSAGQQGGFGLPPSPTAQSSSGLPPMSDARTQQLYGPTSPSGVRQQTTPQRSMASRGQSTVPSGAKPFQGYSRGSAYSPYMALFRDINTPSSMASGVNNYYNLVKPALDQRQKNQHVGQQIRGLQSTAGYQGRSLQQINQQNQARQRPGNMIPGMNAPQRMPATFMNTQQYYPGVR